MKQHKWANEIKALADGKEVEFRYSDNLWYAVKNFYEFDNNSGFTFRIKPEKKPDFTRYYYCSGAWNFTIVREQDANLELTFDGETGNLSSVKLLDPLKPF